MQDKTKLGKSVKIMTMPVTTSVEAEPGETSEEEKLVNASLQENIGILREKIVVMSSE